MPLLDVLDLESLLTPIVQPDRDLGKVEIVCSFQSYVDDEELEVGPTW